MGMLSKIKNVQIKPQIVNECGLDPTLAPKLRREIIERLGLDLCARLVRAGADEHTKEEISACGQTILARSAYGNLLEGQKEQLLSDVIDEICGLGPLQKLIEDNAVTEIMVNGCSSLFYEKGGKIYAANRVFSNKDEIMLIIERILAPLGRRLDETSPIVNARLKNGDRVNAVISPIAIDGPILTIRRFTGRITSLKRLIELESIPTWYAKLLSWAVKLRKNIAVAGGTGSGKTTLLNALSLEIPKEERIITIEDSAELQFSEHPHVVRLEARNKSIENRGEVSIRDLVMNALRMRPDRIVVGEVRGEEAIDMLQAMNTGHDGSLTTLHAGNETETISRLILMARFGMDLPPSLIEQQIASALNLVVMGKRFPNGKRMVTNTSELKEGKDGKVILEPLVRYDEHDSSWHLIREPTFLKDVISSGLATDEELESWKRQVS